MPDRGNPRQASLVLVAALVVGCIGTRQFNGAYFAQTGRKAPASEATWAAGQIANRLGYTVYPMVVGSTYQAVLENPSDRGDAERIVVVVTSNSYDDEYSVVVRKPTPGETERTLEVRRVIEDVLKAQGVTWTVGDWERTMAQ